MIMKSFGHNINTWTCELHLAQFIEPTALCCDVSMLTNE